MTEILIGAAITVMTAAVIGIFTRVSDLTASDVRDQLRLDIHDTTLREIRGDAAQQAAAVEVLKVDVARLRSECRGRRVDSRP